MTSDWMRAARSGRVSSLATKMVQGREQDGKTVRADVAGDREASEHHIYSRRAAVRVELGM